MSENNENADYEYTLRELLEQAKKDESWEPDEKIREQLVAALARSLSNL